MNIKLSLVFILILNSITLNAQNIDQLEQEYMYMQTELYQEKQLLDSLLEVMNERATQIDREKEKRVTNQGKTVDLMAQSVPIANQIESQQIIIAALEKKIETKQQILLYEYSEIIDSLRRVEEKKMSPEEEETIEKLIFYYTEKKLRVSPQIQSLSYDPEKILQINLSAIEDSSERNIYEQYLHSALKEVDNQLQIIQHLSLEINEMSRLQNKANRFLDELEMDSRIVPYAVVKEEYRPEKEEVFNNNGTRGIPSNLVEIDYYMVLMRQLEWVQPREKLSKWQSPLDSTQINLSINEYQILLQEIKQRLQEYGSILKKKITSNE